MHLLVTMVVTILTKIISWKLTLKNSFYPHMFGMDFFNIKLILQSILKLSLTWLVS